MPATVPSDAVPTPVRRLAERLRDAGHQAWIVGGCLRDLLLDRPVNDWDLATTALPGDVQKTFRRVIPTGLQHGTVTVVLDGTPYEVTTLRGEGAYTDGRRPDSVFFVDDIREDLARRDFTVNALAWDPLEETLVDPFGGLDDMRRRLIRAVGDPRERFAEDGLRVLRAARFVATLEFELDPPTEAAIAGALSTYRKVSAERIRDEWLKAFKAERPSRAFEVMRRTGILEVTCPALLEQVGCTQNAHHAYDVWTHTLHCLDAARGHGPELRLAALFHDLGKPRTRALSEKTEDWTFYGHEKVGAGMADEWLESHRFSRRERETVVHLVRHHLVCYAPDWTDAAVRRFVRRVGADRVPMLLALARADARAKGRPVDDELALLDELEGRVADLVSRDTALTTRQLAIGGKDVMAHYDARPGPFVGRVLDALLERVLDDPTLNRRDRLLALLDEPEVRALRGDGGAADPAAEARKP
ncbi:MAG TPA: HD domain-containing protein, partial [Polyangiaceae bacterium LLY-WYZ-14_1]|nr:HD domain-containing protein [Polyangiaceae bacterium LLY-WYZ-14_1]